MRLHRFYIPQNELEHICNQAQLEGLGEVLHAGQTLHFSPKNDYLKPLLHQWKDVFRYKTGDRLYVFNEVAGEWLLECTSFDKKTGADFEVVEQERVARLAVPKREIALYMAVIKNSNFDLVVEKATELGVTRIIPIKTERTVKANLNFERLQRIAIEATEQSGRMSPPLIEGVIDLDQAIDDLIKKYSKGGEVYFGHIQSEGTRPSELLRDGSDPAAIFIGPEGGWTDVEVQLMQEKGMIPISLGQFVLRAETAAITAMAIFGGY